MMYRLSLIACFLLALASCQRGLVSVQSTSLGDQASPGLRSQEEVQQALSQQHPDAGHLAQDEVGSAVGREVGVESTRTPAEKRMRSVSKIPRKSSRHQPVWAGAHDAGADAGLNPSAGDMSRLRAFRPELFMPSPLVPALSAAPLPQARAGNFDLDDPLYLALFIILLLLALLLLILILTEVISALGLIGVLLLAALIIALVLLL